eukprot:6196641-Pleurochrysis_carterae.AAC.2
MGGGGLLSFQPRPPLGLRWPGQRPFSPLWRVRLCQCNRHSSVVVARTLRQRACMRGSQSTFELLAHAQSSRRIGSRRAAIGAEGKQPAHGATEALVRNGRSSRNVCPPLASFSKWLASVRTDLARKVPACTLHGKMRSRSSTSSFTQ